MPYWRVKLPPGVRSPFEVYVNGVRQELGTDYRISEGELLFERELVRQTTRAAGLVPGLLGDRDLQAQRRGRHPLRGRGPAPRSPTSSRSSRRGDDRGGAQRAVRTTSRHPRPQQPQRGQDRARRGRAVQRVEVDARRAARQQLGALQRGVGDAELEHRVGAMRPATRAAASSASGMHAPHMLGEALDLPTSVIGMIPGMIGTSIPTARASSTNRKYASLSKNSWVIRNETPLSTFCLRKRRSLAMSAASGWTSGKHGGADADRVARGDQRGQLARVAQPAGMGPSTRSSPRGGSPRSASTFSIPASTSAVEDHAQLVAASRRRS